MLCSKLTACVDSVDLLRRSRFGAIYGRLMIGVIVEGHDCGSSLEGQSLGLVLKGEGKDHYLQVFFLACQGKECKDKSEEEEEKQRWVGTLERLGDGTGQFSQLCPLHHPVLCLCPGLEQETHHCEYASTWCSLIHTVTFFPLWAFSSGCKMDTRLSLT